MTDDSRIPTNLRTLLILEAIGKLPDPVKPADVGHALGLAKQTTHRLCTTLLDEGFLVQDGPKNGLRPGRRMRLMASGILQASSAHIARHQVLMALAADVRETVNFVVPESRGMTYQDRVETDWAFRIQLPIGTHVPFHCTASGKAYLASLPKGERTRLVHAMRLERMTVKTITEPAALLAELAQIAKTGFALDREEFHDDMIAIAVPVYDTAKRYAASVAFHAPMQRMSIDEAVALKHRMFEASRQLTNVMFGGAEQST
jgi:DNA-binding IclR family transcriptional regulator